ncbi:hypothetical protein MUP79_06890 [Candidatus Bathyarchaeota archaeon]|nr:hypothetical protein [Candidatus Bathyarchaeota archaeon]
MTGTNDVRLRPALGAAKDVYLYPTIYYQTQTFNIDAALKSFGLSTGFGVECLIALLSTRSREVNVDVALKELSLSAPHDIDLVAQKPNFTSGHQIDAWLKATFPSEVNIDALLKALSVSELYQLDIALQKLGFQSTYHTDVLLVLRNRVSHAIGVLISLIPSMPRFFGIGIYLVSPQKFDLTLLFEQLDVESTFEGFEAELSFEQFQVTPYFKEV